MEIPDYLLKQISEGKAVLLLGSGASRDARNSKGKFTPTSKELAILLSEKFLGGKHSDAPLSQVGEYAISESDPISVQSFIKDIMAGFLPSDAHKIMTSFRWRGIATTNYDCLIEKAYEQNKKFACQTPVPFIENGDRVDDKLRYPNAVPLLKLHGCITRISNHNCPLILSVDQYVQYEKGRNRIFDMLKDWGCERSFVFIGQSLQDPDLRTILLMLSQLTESRPRYFLVAPDKDGIQKRFWESKKITTIESSFSDFMTQLNSAISSPFRAIASTQKEHAPICERIAANDQTLSINSLNFVSIDAEYVKAAKSDEIVKPQDFYKGFSRGWGAIEQNLDVRRTLVDKILLNHILVDDVHNNFQFIVIKGHAGSGKSMILRRLAWEAAKDYDKLCLFIKSEGRIDASAIHEIINQCKEHVYLFVDNISERIYEIERLVDSLGDNKKQFSLIGAERLNEWNMLCDSLVPLATSQYTIEHLTEKEIDGLLDLLAKHNSLGTLQSCSQQEKRNAFSRRAGRQLLVALHEATLGKPFEEIVEDEFNSITPLEAQLIYLTICVLSRLRVHVRAGIISRLYGVPFASFKERFFKPLEHIVYDHLSPIIRDYVYSARHPHVADIVFERILKDPEKRYDNYIKCIKALNIDYESDRVAFRKMIQARTLLNTFQNHEHIVQIYKAAELVASDDPHLCHQMGIYEMLRPNGNYDASAKLLEKANRMSPQNPFIKHSYAELYLKRADIARSDLERESFLAEAEKRARSLLGASDWAAYAYHTLIKTNIEKIKIAIKKEDSQDYAIEKIVNETEGILSEAHQQYPENSYLLEADAQLAEIVADSERVHKSLQKAFDANNRNSFVALRMARTSKYKKDIPAALKILDKALDANGNEKKLHYEYATLLMEININNKNGDAILYHLKRSFSPGDKNYIAQLLYGRQLFVNEAINEAKDFFLKLRDLKVSHELGYKLRYPLPNEYTGEIKEKQPMFCFITRDGKRDAIFGHVSNIDETTWKNIVKGNRVRFKIAFNLNGPNAFDINIL